MTTMKILNAFKTTRFFGLTINFSTKRNYKITIMLRAIYHHLKLIYKFIIEIHFYHVNTKYYYLKKLNILKVESIDF